MKQRGHQAHLMIFCTCPLDLLGCSDSFSRVETHRLPCVVLPGDVPTLLMPQHRALQQSPIAKADSMATSIKGKVVVEDIWMEMHPAFRCVYSSLLGSCKYTTNALPPIAGFCAVHHHMAFDRGCASADLAENSFRKLDV